MRRAGASAAGTGHGAGAAPDVPAARAPAARAPVLDRPVERLAVFRALMLGDLLCAVPALRALRRGWPDAAITLVGLPWAAALAERLDCVDDFIAFPGHPELPERACDVGALPGFLAEVQARRFDLALQLHGSGPTVNAVVATFGAARTAGFASPAAWRPAADAAWYAPWPEHGHEIHRLLALTDWLGLERDGLHLDFPLRSEDHDALVATWPGARERGRYVCLHAGAQLASRRWPLERFAEVGNRLAALGATVVLTGSADEAERVARLSAAIDYPTVNLAGRTTLWTLGALIEGAAQLVCNDTGLSHVAAALGTPSVVVASGNDVARWAPLDDARHPVLWHPVACRPCSHAVCPIGHPCALAIGSAEVLQVLEPRLARRPANDTGSENDAEADAVADAGAGADAGIGPGSRQAPATAAAAGPRRIAARLPA